MTLPRQIPREPKYLLVFVPVVLMMAGIGQILSLFSSAEAVFVWLCLLSLVVVATSLAGQMARGMWTGYIAFAVVVLVFVLGLPVTLFNVLLGTFLAYLWWAHKRPDVISLRDVLARIALAGNGAVIVFALYYGLGGHLPLKDFSDLQDFIALSVSCSVLYAFLYLAGGWFAGKTREETLDIAAKSVGMDALLCIVAVISPVIRQNDGSAVMVVLLVMVMVQAVRYRQISDARAELEQRAREVVTLSNLGQAVSTTLNLASLLVRVHQQIAQLAGGGTIFTALYDPKQQAIDYPLVTSDGETLRWQRRKLQGGLTDWVIRNRAPLLLNTIEPAKFEAMGIHALDVESRAYMGVPLMVGNELIGVLGILHRENSGAFSHVGLSVLQAIASQASLAIRNASLYERTARLVDNLALINHSLQDVMFNLDRESAMTVACEVACNVTGAHKAIVFLVTDRVRLRPMATYHVHLPKDILLVYQQDLYVQGARHVPNVLECDDEQLRQLASELGFMATLEVPLRTGNTVVGLLAVYHDQAHYYEQSDFNLLEMVTSQVTAAFDNADLLQALELYAGEQAQLVQLSRMTSSHLDLERVVVEVSEVMKQMLDMQTADICFVTEDVGVLERLRPQEGRISEQRLDLSTYPEMTVVLNNPILTNPYILYADDDSLSEAMQGWMVLEGWQTLAITPMLVNKRVFGVLFLGSGQRMVFLDNHRRLLEMATNQVSAQIYNARLHLMTELALAQQLEQLALIEDIAQKVSQSLELNVIISNVLDAARQSTQADEVEMVLRTETRWQVIVPAKSDPEGLVTVFQERLSPIMEEVVQTGVWANDDTAGSGLIVPLFSGEEVLGVLRVGSAKPNAFTQEHVRFIQSLAGHAAISIRNAELLEERQAQISTLTTLRTLTLESVGTDNQEFVALAILKATLKLLGGAEATLYGYDARTDELVIIAGAALHGDELTLIIPSFASAFILDAVHEGKVRLVERRTPNDADEELHSPFFSTLSIPIWRNNAIREVIAVGYTRSVRFTARDLNTVELLSAQVAGHLDSVALNQALRASNERSRVILDSTRDGIILLDNGGRVQDANLAASSVLQIDLNKHVGENFKRLLANYYPEENAPEKPKTAAPVPYGDMLELGAFGTSENMPAQREFRLSYRGAVDYVQAQILPVRDGDGVPMGRLLLLRDITEEKNLANTRESLQRMVIHDLRSPLGAIVSSLAFMQILVDDFPNDQTTDIRKTISISLESANTLMRLMDTLRDLPRMKDREMRVEPQLLSLRQLAQKAYDMLGASFKEANINMEIRVPQDLQVCVDPDLTRRVLINLLHNAFKFTPENGTILIVAEPPKKPGGMARVLVCDTGPGVPTDKRDIIFEEFKQVDNVSPARGGRGTGLGLTFCRLAVEAHGGTIRLEDEGVLPGACFSFTLPTTP